MPGVQAASRGDPDAVEVRPYRPEDRDPVRQICHATGYMGEEIRWAWRDAESFADMFSGYYTDREPESITVVDQGGEVTGYLLGCVDTRKAESSTTVAARHALGRALLVRPGTARFLWRGMLDLLRDAGRRGRSSAFDDPRWPAHLHIDLLRRARGHGAGRLLMERWMARLEELGVPGVHLGTFLENQPAIAFFERLGFCRHGEPVRVPGFRTRVGARMHSQIMVRSL